MQKIKLYNAHCCGEIGDVVVGLLDNLNFEILFTRIRLKLKVVVDGLFVLIRGTRIERKMVELQIIL